MNAVAYANSRIITLESLEVYDLYLSRYDYAGHTYQARAEVYQAPDGTWTCLREVNDETTGTVTKVTQFEANKEQLARAAAIRHCAYSNNGAVTA